MGCGKTYKVLSSFTSHLSRQHKVLPAPENTLSEVPVSENLDVDVNANAESEHNNCSTNVPVSSLSQDDLLKKQALFLMSLQYKHLIPAATVTKITAEYDEMIKSHTAIIESALGSILQKHEVSSEISQSILECVFSTANDGLYHNTLHSEHLRTNF